MALGSMVIFLVSTLDAESAQHDCKPFQIPHQSISSRTDELIDGPMNLCQKHNEGFELNW